MLDTEYTDGERKLKSGTFFEIKPRAFLTQLGAATIPGRYIHQHS
jgi:hypothetical protein